MSRLRKEAVSCLFLRVLWPKCWPSMSSEPEEREMESRDSFLCLRGGGRVELREQVSVLSLKVVGL